MTAVLNLPLIADTLAVRGVIYDDRRGGYINNVPATFTRKATDLGIHYANYPDGLRRCAARPCQPCPPGATDQQLRHRRQRDQSGDLSRALRVSALWDINADWNALLTQSYQNMDAQGVFYQMPNSSDGEPLPQQSVTLFNPSYNKDRFENTALTINGRIGDLKAVYTGAYLVRNIDQLQDYTNYARGVYADYYQCHGAEPANGLAATCYSPRTTWNETERNTHQSHELRLSTPDDWRLRGIVGAFWEELQIEDQLNWLYKTLPACTDDRDGGMLDGCRPRARNERRTTRATRNDNIAFFNDVQRGYRQTAFFTSLGFRHHPQGADGDRRHALLPTSSTTRRAPVAAASAATRPVPRRA